MALNFDDQILGEKVNNYCSSSEDEEDETENVSVGDEDEEVIRSNHMRNKHSQIEKSQPVPSVQTGKRQTGPKGVLDDYKDYKEMENLKKIEEQNELINLYKNLSANCKTNAEIEAMNKEDEEYRELLESIDGADEILAEFHEKRLNEMRNIYLELPTFDQVYELDESTFSSSIDNEHKMICVIIHLYEPKLDACDTVKGCFLCLAQQYPHVKFCNMRASSANMSQRFLDKALPAIVVYKGGELIGNIIQLTKYLGEDFFANEMEQFLQEHGFIPDKVTDAACKLSTYRSINSREDEDDYNID